MGSGGLATLPCTCGTFFGSPFADPAHKDGCPARPRADVGLSDEDVRRIAVEVADELERRSILREAARLVVPF